MEQFKEPEAKSPFDTVVSSEVEEVALRAAELPDFQETVRNAPNRIEAIRAVRELLREQFPEIEAIPAPRQGPSQAPVGGLPGNEFLVAKAVVELLSEPLEDTAS